MKQIFLLLTLFVATANAQIRWDAAGNGNPIVPGYFADPTIRHFGDTYYIYSTTDGTGNGYGPAQVWLSRDLRHWRNIVMNWPTTEVVWAPDVIETSDHHFRYYYCEPCMIHVGEGTSPVGPWRNMLGESDAVLMPDRFCDPMAITLDPMVYTDDDGQQYIFVGTWGIYDHSGCGWARLAPDGKTLLDHGLVPNTELHDFFEAPFVFKRNGIYYFTYSSGSCHDDTYRVQYATSTAGPTGPYTYRGCILKTNADGTIHGPGHHSMLQEGDDWYIIYHRHNNPHAIHGFNRQLCIDRLQFAADGTILPVVPTHEGTFPKTATQIKQPVNLALGAHVTASSTLSPDFKAAYAVDDNNGTLWRAANNQGPASLTIDMGRVKRFNQVWLEFEYPTFFYQYLLETSAEGTVWHTYADRRGNRQAGSPVIEHGDVKARFLRVTITDTQKNGHFPALWNVKVYRASRNLDPEKLLPPVPEMDSTAVLNAYPMLHRKNVESAERQDYGQGPCLLLDADDTSTLNAFRGGEGIIREVIAGKYGYFFDGQTQLEAIAPCPKNFTYNAAYSVSAWVYNPDISPVECILSVTPPAGDLTALQIGHGSNAADGIIQHAGSFESQGAPDALKARQWQHLLVTYDGWMERIYLDGQLVKEQNNFIMLRPSAPMTIGMTPSGSDAFTGYIHSLSLYDRALTPDEVHEQYIAQYTARTVPSTPIDLSSLSLKADREGAMLARVTLCDAQGQPVRSGRLNFSSALVSLQQKEQSYSLTVTDGELGTTQTLTAQLPAASIGNAYTLSDITDTPHGENITISRDEGNGIGRLSSHDTNFNLNPDEQGAFMGREIKGDFVIQARLSDMEGLANHSVPAYSEAGLMLQIGDDMLLHLGVFPLYGCGNMLTMVSPQGRPQYPNQKGYDFHPWMQIERRGDIFYARTSADGQVWTDMPGSPIDLSTTHPTVIRAGLYHTTYTPNTSWAEISDFHLWQ